MVDSEDALSRLEVALAEISRQSLQKRNRHDVMLRLAALPMFEDMHEVLDSRQLGLLETLEAIRSKNLSFARFGDGEFLLMLKAEHNIRFQKNSPALQIAMKQALIVASTHEENILIGYPNLFHNIHWTGVFSEVWPLMKRFAVNFDRLGNSHISRPLAFEVLGSSACHAWRSLWEDSRAIVVTGRGSRFDLEPALFSNLKSVDFVYSEPAHAFVDLPRLVEELAALKPEKVLISLGPAGSILAVELAQLGIQALDIGHLSSSYKNVMAGGRFPEDTPHHRV